MSDTSHDSGSHEPFLPDAGDAVLFSLDAVVHAATDAIDHAFSPQPPSPHDPHADGVAAMEILWSQLAGLPLDGLPIIALPRGTIARIFGRGGAQRFTPSAEDIAMSHDGGRDIP